MEKEIKKRKGLVGKDNPMYGKISPMRGKKMSEESRKKMSEIKKGKMPKFIPTFLGKKHDNNSKLKISNSHKGKKYTKEHIENSSGCNHHNWQGGKVSLNNRIRKCAEYRQWLQDVLKRDDYTCQECGIRGGKLQVHHIKQMALIITENKIDTFEKALLCYELFENDNGQTLCIDCHKKTDSYLKALIIN